MIQTASLPSWARLPVRARKIPADHIRSFEQRMLEAGAPCRLSNEAIACKDVVLRLVRPALSKPKKPKSLLAWGAQIEPLVSGLLAEGKFKKALLVQETDGRPSGFWDPSRLFSSDPKVRHSSLLFERLAHTEKLLDEKLLFAPNGAYVLARGRTLDSLCERYVGPLEGKRVRAEIGRRLQKQLRERFRESEAPATPGRSLPSRPHVYEVCLVQGATYIAYREGDGEAGAVNRAADSKATKGRAPHPHEFFNVYMSFAPDPADIVLLNLVSHEADSGLLAFVLNAFNYVKKGGALVARLHAPAGLSGLVEGELQLGTEGSGPDRLALALHAQLPKGASVGFFCVPVTYWAGLDGAYPVAFIGPSHPDGGRFALDELYVVMYKNRK
ncbi:MAG: hypothetical protein V1728_00715 [Candidatus Micrarchaeota archaeon]